MTTTSSNTIDYYEIASRQILAQVLPSGFPKTTLWGFGPANDPATSPNFHSPAATIIAKVDRPVEVKWMNQLFQNGHFVTYPSGVSVNTDILFANPAEACDHGPGPDCKGTGGLYLGPVPTVVHLHGISANSESDGIPEAWNLPDATKAGFTTAAFPGVHGQDFCQVDPTTHMRQAICTYNNDGAALFHYPNTQFPSTLFFHDHALGVTTENVYMGLVGFYELRGTTFSTSAPPTPTSVDDVPSDCGGTCSSSTPGVQTGGLPGGAFDIPLDIAARSFNTDGSLRYTDSGNFKVVNGVTWPFLNVQPRKYRFRIVDGSPVDPQVLMFSDNGTAPKMTLIGNDAGFLPHPVLVTKVQFSPGERLDMVIDFTGFAVGSKITFLDDNGGGDGGKIMQFNVVPLVGTDTSTIPSTLPSRPAITSPVTLTRAVALFDNHLGIVTNGTGIPMGFDDPVTESPTEKTTEIWEMWDFEDSHPMHLHEVQFQVINREKISCVTGGTPCPQPPSPSEGGFKDTVFANGGQITRILVQFNDAEGSAHTGLFAWHCHINPHEDNEMMRPMCVLRTGQAAGNAENFCQ